MNVLPTIVILSCEATTSKLLNFELDNLDLDAINPKTNQTNIHYLIVRAVLGSGLTTIASSDGFYIDVTPPTFDRDVMMYIDVTQGAFQPTDFQASNSTIKSIWKCDDLESGIKEYWWAVGSTEGGQELQGFMSTGIFSTGTNDSFLGILEHNTTYFVSIVCLNGAGLSSRYNDTQGITVLMEPPSADDVETTVVGAEKFSAEVFPHDAMQSHDSTSIGASWTVGEDKFLRKYEACIGSSSEILDDVFPCTWVGYNVSGQMVIKNGDLMINNKTIWRLSQLKPQSTNVTDLNAEVDVNNVFKMEVGRTLYVKMRLCNEANLCVLRAVSQVVITDDKTQMVTSENGTKLEIHVTLPDSASRKKRAAHGLSIQTPDGLVTGQSILVNLLTEADLQTEYRSDASADFIPYIVNPAFTLDKTDRWLMKRIQSAFDFFTVVSVGQLKLPGPLMVIFPSYNTSDGTGDDSITTLIHWNPAASRWELSSKTCPFGEDILDEDQETKTVKICDTWKTLGGTKSESLVRQRRSTGSHTPEASHSDTSYFSRETLFGLAVISRSIPNSPPRLTSRSLITINEDEGRNIIFFLLMYQLEVADDDNDPVDFRLNSSYGGTTMGTLSLTAMGLLTYIPCKDCYGEEVVPVILADSPVDPTEPVTILMEQQTDKVVFEALLGAYDVDVTDNLTVVMEGHLNGTWQIGEEDTHVPQTNNCPTTITDSSFPCGELMLPHPAADLSWVYVTLRYEQEALYHGVEALKIYVKDSSGSVSDVLTLNVAVLEFPCQNGGSCTSPEGAAYTCNSVQQATDFDKYFNCACLPGFRGKHCEIILETSHTEESHTQIPTDLRMSIHVSSTASECVCEDGVDSTTCKCSDEDLSTGLPVWAIVVIAISCILLVGISVMCLCLYNKSRPHNKDDQLYIVSRSGSKVSDIFGGRQSLSSSLSELRYDYDNRGIMAGVNRFGEDSPFGRSPTDVYCDDLFGLHGQTPGGGSMFSLRRAWEEDSADTTSGNHSNSRSWSKFTSSVPLSLQQQVDPSLQDAMSSDTEQHPPPQILHLDNGEGEPNCQQLQGLVSLPGVIPPPRRKNKFTESSA
ncbi:hypothetical protein ScPMuIL_015302 [Solemya velum]